MLPTIELSPCSNINSTQCACGNSFENSVEERLKVCIVCVLALFPNTINKRKYIEMIKKYRSSGNIYKILL
jgi:hypothetical protein